MALLNWMSWAGYNQHQRHLAQKTNVGVGGVADVSLGRRMMLNPSTLIIPRVPLLILLLVLLPVPSRQQ